MLSLDMNAVNNTVIQTLFIYMMIFLKLYFRILICCNLTNSNFLKEDIEILILEFDLQIVNKGKTQTVLRYISNNYQGGRGY